MWSNQTLCLWNVTYHPNVLAFALFDVFAWSQPAGTRFDDFRRSTSEILRRIWCSKRNLWRAFLCWVNNFWRQNQPLQKDSHEKCSNAPEAPEWKPQKNTRQLKGHTLTHIWMCCLIAGHAFVYVMYPSLHCLIVMYLAANKLHCRVIKKYNQPNHDAHACIWLCCARVWTLRKQEVRRAKNLRTCLRTRRVSSRALDWILARLLAWVQRKVLLESR